MSPQTVHHRPCLGEVVHMLRYRVAAVAESTFGRRALVKSRRWTGSSSPDFPRSHHDPHHITDILEWYLA